MYIVTDKGSQYLDKYFKKGSYESKSGSSTNRKARVISLVEYIPSADTSSVLREVSRQRRREKSNSPSWNVPGSDSDYRRVISSLLKQGYLEEVEDPLPGEEIGSYGYEERTGNYADSLAIELGKRSK